MLRASSIATVLGNIVVIAHSCMNTGSAVLVTEKLFLKHTRVKPYYIRMFSFSSMSYFIKQDFLVQSAYFDRVYLAAGFDCVLFCLAEKIGRR